MTNAAHYPSLAGMPVIISGGASGIGESLVRNFAAQGAKVGFVDLQAERGAALAGELMAAGQVARFIACDVTDIAAYRASLKEMGPVYREVLGRHFPAMAVVQVVALVEPQALVEIEATAVIAA